MGRLFWKIFLWFWLALALLNIAVGWGVKIYFEHTSNLDQRTLQAQVSAVALAFDRGDSPRARQILKDISRESTLPVFVVNPEGRDILSRHLPPFLRHRIDTAKLDSRHILHTKVELPGGEQYLVVALRHPRFKDKLTSAPAGLGLVIALVISTLVCYWLAKYLSSPIRLLSTATHQLAEGQLDVRIGKLRRRDELADLAADFDRMAAKIQQLLNAQKQLLQDISHELRSPLARLQVALALAKRNSNDASTDYDRLSKDLDRLDVLIGEVLTLARLDTLSYPKQCCNLSVLLASIVEDCQMEASLKGCHIVASITPDISAHGSPELLHRAMENIIRNAVKFTYPDTTIEVSLTTDSHSVGFRVADQGPGIPEGSAASLFEPFVRLDQARQHKTGGYGLGLAIARKAIELHGGTISAHNRRDQQGLVVILTLPKSLATSAHNDPA